MLTLLKTKRGLLGLLFLASAFLFLPGSSAAGEDGIFTQSALGPKLIAKIKNKSWKTPAPISLNDLACLTITYFGFDAKPHSGEIIVNKRVAAEVLDIFKELYRAKFPIAKMKLIDEYNADDERSMADNNTCALCVRPLTGKNRGFSRHSYGLAIDINPLQNPYVKGKVVSPAAGKDYLDRTKTRKGMIVKNNICYNAFIKRGWAWGGEWKSLKDYQHFEK